MYAIPARPHRSRRSLGGSSHVAGLKLSTWYGCHLGGFVRLLTVGEDVSLTLCPALAPLLLLLGCLVQPGQVRCLFILSNCISLCHVWL